MFTISHNATGLALVRITHNELPETKNLAYFDSQFHKSIPEHIRTYAIDPKVANKNKLRKYGFHGISYAFITQAVAKHLDKPVDQLNIIALHLGSGASACCIRGGKSYDTSMGLTPVSGLPGGTRSGDVDPRPVLSLELVQFIELTLPTAWYFIILTTRASRARRVRKICILPQ